VRGIVNSGREQGNRGRDCTPDQAERQDAKAFASKRAYKRRMPLRVCANGTQVEQDGLALYLAGGTSGKGERAEKGGILMKSFIYMSAMSARKRFFG